MSCQCIVHCVLMAHRLKWEHVCEWCINRPISYNRDPCLPCQCVLHLPPDCLQAAMRSLSVPCLGVVYSPCSICCDSFCHVRVSFIDFLMGYCMKWESLTTRTELICICLLPRQQDQCNCCIYVQALAALHFRVQKLHVCWVSSNKSGLLLLLQHDTEFGHIINSEPECAFQR